MRHSKVSLASLLVFSLSACGGGGPPKPSAKEKAAAAAAKAEAETKAAIAKRTEARLAKKKAEEEAAAKKMEAIAALAKLPEKLPKNLKKACDGVEKASNAFMTRHFEGLDQQKISMQTQMMKKRCLSGGSVEVAACQSVAMDGASEEFKKDLPELIKACMKKFGAEGEKEGEAPT